MRLTVVGCTGSMSGPQSPASCYLVTARGADESGSAVREWNVVLDLGPGAFGQLSRYLDPRLIDAVIFSHTHADHIGDVISLHVHRRWHPGGGMAELPLAGPEGLMDRVRQIDGVGEEERYQGEFLPHTLRAGEALRVGPMTITPFTALHSVPAFGLRVEGPSEDDPSRSVSLAYTGDTDLCDSIVEMATDCQLLVSEAGFSRRDTSRGIHLTGERAGQLATRARVERLILTHIQPWTDVSEVVSDARGTWAGPLEVAHSGLVRDL